VDAKGQVVNDKESFPGALGDTEHVELLYPRKDHFIASDYDLNQRDHDEMTGVNLSSDPELEIRKNVFGYSYSALQKTFERTVDVPPLFDPKTSVVSLVSRGEIIQMDMTEKKQERLIPLPVEELVEWSLLENGNYGLLGYEKGEKVVAEVGQSGDVLWRYSDAAGKDKWLVHPPVSGPGGAVYVLTDQRVVAIKKGAAVWACDFGGTVQAGFACALADGSLLATHNGTLQHLDKNGKALFTLKLDSPIVGPPAVDKSGSVFVATASQLLRID
jgi:outer membrane protein assembly factor BamB